MKDFITMTNAIKHETLQLLRREREKEEEIDMMT